MARSRWSLSGIAVLAMAVPLALAAAMPFGLSPAPADRDDYASYLYIESQAHLPGPYSPDDTWWLTDYRGDDPLVSYNPQEFYGVRGMGANRAWEVTTGRPDVVIAVVDSGIRWRRDADCNLLRKLYLNRGELPVPAGGPNPSDTRFGGYDVNGDGVFNVADYWGDPRVTDANGNGWIDPEDLILLFSDGVDDDGNGYVDDISGWDFYEGDNDPLDDTDFGHGTSLGVEPVQRDAARRNCPAKPADAYLWLEVDSQPNSEGRGCGKKLARIRYHSGWTYTYSDGAITVSDGRGKPVDGDARVFDPLSGATMVSPVYDPSTDQVLVHYFRDHTWTYALFDRPDLLTQGDEATDLLAPGLAAPSPSEPDKTKKEYFQGVAFSGDWIYTLVGYRDRAITRITAFKTDGTSVSSAVVAAAVHQKLTRTYGTYEPEGMAVRILADGTPRLRWGMSVGKSGISKGRFNRKLVIFEKAALRA